MCEVTRYRQSMPRAQNHYRKKLTSLVMILRHHGETLLIRALLFVALFPIANVCRADETPAAIPPPAPQFERDIHPLLKTYCWKCHGGEGYAAELDFRSLPLLLKGGKNGKVLEPGSAGKSLLYQKLVAKQMPPGDRSEERRGRE